MQKNSHKVLNRVFCFITVFVLLVSTVFPAFALSPNIQVEDSGTKVRPFVSGDFLIELDRSDIDPQFGYLAVEGSLVDWVPVTWDSYNVSAFSRVNGVVADVYFYQYTMRERAIVNGEDHFRINDKFEFFGEDSVSYLQRRWTFTLDDFGGSWDRWFLNSLFYIKGEFSFVTSFTLWAVTDEGKLVSTFYNESGTSAGTQSVMYNARLDAAAERVGITRGEPYFITDWKCVVVPNPLPINHTNFEVSRLGTPVGVLASNGESVTKWPISYGSLQEFMSNVVTGDVPDLDANSFGSWLAGVASSFFDVEIFGFFSLGDVALVVFSVGIVFWLLKIFAGG